MNGVENKAMITSMLGKVETFNPEQCL